MNVQPRFKKIKGKRYHKFVITDDYAYKKNGLIYVEALCDCGETFTFAKKKLKNKKCCPKCIAKINGEKQRTPDKKLIGLKSGRLTVIGVERNDKRTNLICQCECGNTCSVNRVDFRSKHTRSCGCLASDVRRALNEKDYSGIVSERGVKFIKKHELNKYQEYLWECECGQCGTHFFSLPYDVMSGRVVSCGCVRRSKNEAFIISLLEKYNYSYETEKSFEDCKYKNTLKFDFAVYDDNKELLCLIEYDGKQHYEPNNHFGGTDGYNKTVIRDQIKNQYCTDNNIRLIRIPYTYTNEEIERIIININNL